MPFPVRLRNPLISAGLEPVLSYTDKSCIVSYFIQFSMSIKLKLIMILKLVLLALTRCY